MPGLRRSYDEMLHYTTRQEIKRLNPFKLSVMSFSKYFNCEMPHGSTPNSMIL